MSAPVPTAFAFNGFSSFQTKYRINPTRGIQNPSNPHPNPPVSIAPDELLDELETVEFVGTPQ
jgi:hypothetical protein